MVFVDPEFRAFDSSSGKFFYSKVMGLSSFFSELSQIRKSTTVILQQSSGVKDGGDDKAHIFSGDILSNKDGSVRFLVDYVPHMGAFMLMQHNSVTRNEPEYLSQGFIDKHSLIVTGNICIEPGFLEKSA